MLWLPALKKCVSSFLLRVDNTQEATFAPV
jgi:hypothetical protein